MNINPSVKSSYWLLTYRILLIMKLAVFPNRFTALQATAESYAQRITLELQNVSLAEAMASVQKQTGYPFFLQGKDIAHAKITTQMRNTDLEEAMSRLLKGLPLEWV